MICIYMCVCMYVYICSHVYIYSIRMNMHSFIAKYVLSLLLAMHKNKGIIILDASSYELHKIIVHCDSNNKETLM